MAVGAREVGEGGRLVTTEPGCAFGRLGEPKASIFSPANRSNIQCAQGSVFMTLERDHGQKMFCMANKYIVVYMIILDIYEHLFSIVYTSTHT